MSRVRHINWSTNDAYGRMGVKISEVDRIEIRQISGPAPPPTIIGRILDHLSLWDRCHELHLGRIDQWSTERRTAVEVRIGMSGARNYLLRVEQDPEWGNCPIVARIHVSMYGKLNEGLPSTWLGDLIPLCIAAGIGSEGENEMEISDAEVFTPQGGWKTAKEWYCPE